MRIQGLTRVGTALVTATVATVATVVAVVCGLCPRPSSPSTAPEVIAVDWEDELVTVRLEDYQAMRSALLRLGIGD